MAQLESNRCIVLERTSTHEGIAVSQSRTSFVMPLRAVDKVLLHGPAMFPCAARKRSMYFAR